MNKKIICLSVLFAVVCVAVSAAFTAAITSKIDEDKRLELRNELEETAGRVESLEGEKADSEDKIITLKSDISDLNDEAEGLELAKEKMQPYLDKIEGYKESLDYFISENEYLLDMQFEQFSANYDTIMTKLMENSVDQVDIANSIVSSMGIIWLAPITKSMSSQMTSDNQKVYDGTVMINEFITEELTSSISQMNETLVTIKNRCTNLNTYIENAENGEDIIVNCEYLDSVFENGTASYIFGDDLRKVLKSAEEIRLKLRLAEYIYGYAIYESSEKFEYYAKIEEMRDSYQTLIDKYSGGNTYLPRSENDEISCRFLDKYAELIDDTIKYRMDVHYRKGSGYMSGCMIGSQATDTVSSGHYYTILFDDDGLCKFYFDVVGQLFMIKYTAYDDAKAYYYEGELIKFNDVFKYHHNRGNDALGSDSYEAFAEWASDNVYSQSSEYRKRSLIYGMSVDND